ncbi:hypothetical protein Acr_00g0023520 [Actinidia rufa]|uniref:Uncharacterized protein n=1 Tax=Actinidia rufa TaxID=165716 RepID=A0A7J0DE60_9ERIC|nr:hypothetical protein Acr_00g0023520 [Actinidia rufa]
MHLKSMAKRLRAGVNPTDQHLINDYLFNKIVGKELLFEGIILERDDYGEQVLSEIFRSWGVDDPIILLHPIEEEDCKRVDEPLETARGGFSTQGLLMPLNLSKDDVICMLQKSRGGKHGKEEKVQSKENGDEALVNMRNVIKSAPIVDEKVGLIHGDGVETLEQIMQDLLAPDSSMENVANVVATDTSATLMPSSHYDVSDFILLFDNMPPLKCRPNQHRQWTRMVAMPQEKVRSEFSQALLINPYIPPSIADQSLLSSKPKYAVLDYICSLDSAPEVIEAENDVGILEQPSIPAPKSLPANSPGHAILSSIISMATPSPAVEPSIMQDPFLNKYPEVTAAENDAGILEQPAPTVEPSYSFAEDLLGVQLLIWEENEEEGELLEFPNPTYDWLFR